MLAFRNPTLVPDRLMLRLLERTLVGKLDSFERAILWHGAAWFGVILLSYYILRPIREQISATYGIKNLSWLFSATFVAMLLGIPLYSALVARFDRRLLVPAIYAFFVVTLGGFWAAMRFGAEDIQLWVARILFVWISVFSLFIVSFFWSVMGDMVSPEQGRRMFGVMAGGGTIGSMIGSQIAARLVSRIGVANLLLIPLVLLCLALVVYGSLERSFRRLSPPTSISSSRAGKATGGNPFAGFTAVAQSRYLLAICAFGFLLATCGTTIYFQQSEIVSATFGTLSVERAQEASTRYFAYVNFYVSVVTLFFQFVLVGLLMRNVGLGWTLALLPMAYIGGISALALSPTISVLAVISVTGRAAEYGIANPAREVLFTAVNREDRYKAKSFIDTVVRRGGDTMVGAIYRVLRESGGFAMSSLSAMVIPIAMVWTCLAVFIGYENARVAASQKTA